MFGPCFDTSVVHMCRRVSSNGNAGGFFISVAHEAFVYRNVGRERRTSEGRTVGTREPLFWFSMAEHLADRILELTRKLEGGSRDSVRQLFRDVQEREHRRKQLWHMHALATAKPAAPISSPECANAPAAATAAAASAAESTAVCATSPQPRRYEPRFQGNYKAFRKADNAWHERARRKRLRHK